MNQSERLSIVNWIKKTEKRLPLFQSLHPVNEPEQKRLFFAGKIDEPVFKYPEVDLPDVSDAPETEVNDELDQLYKDRLDHTLGIYELIKTRGQDDKFTQLSHQVFPVELNPKCHPEQIPKCHPELRRRIDTLVPDTNQSNTVPTTNLIQAFKSALDEYHITGWQVKTSNNISSRLLINQDHKQIIIRENATITQTELPGLIRHEIGVHVIRFINGQKQAEPIFHVGTKKGLLFEEGIAVFMEDPNGPPRIFFRHKAVCLSQKKSFRQVWHSLVKDGTDLTSAWNITLRVKRGLKNGSSLGGFTRDALYAEQFLKMKKFAEEHSDINPLLAAPIAPEEIRFLK